MFYVYTMNILYVVTPKMKYFFRDGHKKISADFFGLQVVAWTWGGGDLANDWVILWHR